MPLYEKTINVMVYLQLWTDHLHKSFFAMFEGQYEK